MIGNAAAQGLRVADLWVAPAVARAAGVCGRGFDGPRRPPSLGLRLGPPEQVQAFERWRIGDGDGRNETWVGLRGRRYHLVDGGPWVNQVALRVVFAHRLWDEGGLVLHASAVREGERAFLFLGRSGIGKSTLAANAVGERASDDTVILRRQGRRLLAFGTPFGRPDVHGCPDGLLPAALCFADQAEDMRITPIRRGPEVARRLAAQIFTPPGTEALSPSMWQSVLEIAATVPAYDLAVPLGYRFEGRHLAEAGIR
jgi:hypothetical protein